MMIFSRPRSLANVRRFVEFIVALVVVSWSVTHYPIDVYVTRMSSFLINPHVNFVIGNAIVMLLLFIYRKNYAGLCSGANDTQYEYFHIAAVPDQCDETEGESKQFSGIVGDFVDTQSEFGLKKSIDIVAEKNEIVSMFDNWTTGVQCDVVTANTEKVHRLQRTKSELLNSKVHGLQRAKSELVNYEGRDSIQGKLRRSESEISTRSVSSFETVDKLSNEEFKHTIEAFIANHQKLLWAQKANE